MHSIYLLTPTGWQRIRECQSFHEACRLCSQLQLASPDEQFCVNT